MVVDEWMMNGWEQDPIGILSRPFVVVPSPTFFSPYQLPVLKFLPILKRPTARLFLTYILFFITLTRSSIASNNILACLCKLLASLKDDWTSILRSSPMPSKEEALALKEKGNKAVKEHDWPTALNYYTQAIDLNDQEASFFSNRTQVGRSSPLRSIGHNVVMVELTYLRRPGACQVERQSNIRNNDLGKTEGKERFRGDDSSK